MHKAFVAFSDRKNSGGWYEDERGCHIWVGYRNSDGYGIVGYKGRSCKAHRVRYELEVGAVPEGMELDHYVCDRGAEGCCNPLHCRPVTHRENVLRGNSPASFNLTKTHCPKGHPLSGSNLVAVYTKRLCRRCRNDGVNARRRREREVNA